MDGGGIEPPGSGSRSQTPGNQLTALVVERDGCNRHVHPELGAYYGGSNSIVTVPSGKIVMVTFVARFIIGVFTSLIRA